MRCLTLASALVLLALPTMARAHAGSNDPNMVHACVGNVSKVVRVVAVNGSCLSSPPLVAETPVHWAIRGPQGANGTNGLDGTSVMFVDYFSGNQHGCPSGGAIYAAGHPPVNTFVCNGANSQGAQRAAGPCFTNDALHARYVDCGNGTVTDLLTGLIWLRQADCLPNLDWAAANQAAAGLQAGDCGLTDWSSAGDWRLPTKDEWSATIAEAFALGCNGDSAPSLTNDSGSGCLVEGPSSFTGATEGIYWSSSIFPVYSPNLEVAWSAVLTFGKVDWRNKPHSWRVWPVRSGSH